MYCIKFVSNLVPLTEALFSLGLEDAVWTVQHYVGIYLFMLMFSL